MPQIMTIQIRDRQLAESIVEDRGRHFDGVIAGDNALRFKAGESIGLDKFLERHAILQADRHGDGKIVHQ